MPLQFNHNHTKNNNNRDLPSLSGSVAGGKCQAGRGVCKSNFAPPPPPPGNGNANGALSSLQAISEFPIGSFMEVNARQGDRTIRKSRASESCGCICSRCGDDCAFRSEATRYEAKCSVAAPKGAHENPFVGTGSPDAQVPSKAQTTSLEGGQRREDGR